MEFEKIMDPLEQFEMVQGLGFYSNYVNRVRCLGVMGAVIYLRRRKYRFKFVYYRMRERVEFGKGIIQSQFDVIAKKHNVFLPLFIALFMFVLGANIRGRWPYQFTITRQLSVVLGVVCTAYIALIVNGVVAHGWGWWKLFLPSGVPLRISTFLVRLELISYFSRVLSLSVRLFANIISGHRLMKILSGFGISRAVLGRIKGLSHLIILSIGPVFVLVIIFCLECGIAVLQRYVFTLLLSMYTRESLVGGVH